MNVLIRFIQLVFGLVALNQVYGLALLFGFRTLYGAKSAIWDLLSLAVSALVCVGFIFLLQRYYEKRNALLTHLSGRKFTATSLVLAGVVACAGLAVVVLLAVFAFSQI